jgi:hypothetical protein
MHVCGMTVSLLVWTPCSVDCPKDRQPHPSSTCYTPSPSTDWEEKSHYGYADDCGMLAIADTVEESTRLAFRMLWLMSPPYQSVWRPTQRSKILRSNDIHAWRLLTSGQFDTTLMSMPMSYGYTQSRHYRVYLFDARLSRRLASGGA